MNPFQQFLANRASKGGKPEPSFADGPVTRAEFTTLARVVNALMDDVQSVTEPGKLQQVVNEAFATAAKGVKPVTNVRARPDRTALMPKDDDTPVTTTKRQSLAPKGE